MDEKRTPYGRPGVDLYKSHFPSPALSVAGSKGPELHFAPSQPTDAVGTPMHCIKLAIY